MPDEKPKLGLMRKPMYEVGDGILGLHYVADIVEDAEIKRLVTRMQATQEQLRDYLNENYLWD